MICVTTKVDVGVVNRVVNNNNWGGGLKCSVMIKNFHTPSSHTLNARKIFVTHPRMRKNNVAALHYTVVS